MAQVIRRPFLLWPLLISLLVLILDLVTKYLIVRTLGPEADVHSIDLWGPIRLIYVENTGVSFGRLQGQSVIVASLGLLALTVLSLSYCYLLTDSRWANLALGLILGGAWGNLIDRLLNGLRVGMPQCYVVDFVDLGYWPVFNLADSAITIGGILYGVYIVFFQSRTGQDQMEASVDPSGPADPASGE
ncbi:MAG: signal peptidase II [Chloroflexia bacterium]|nr:signal peptidase II [Chloroflexia bacterium]